MTTEPVNILLVEDDDVEAEAIQRAFEKADVKHPLYRAKDGVEALEMLKGENARYSIPKPHLLLIDINMPRMSGIELLSHIRSEPTYKRTLAFVLTTSKSLEDRMRAYNYNIAGFVNKSDVNKDYKNVINMLENYTEIVAFP